MAKAHYQIQIPSVDALGAPLRIGEAAHQYITSGPIRVEMAYLTQAHPHDVLHVHAEDHPKTDSHIKQLAAFVGELANAQSISAAKHGKNVQTWAIANSHHRPGLGADPSAHKVPVPNPRL